jgi:hypothetical protein
MAKKTALSAFSSLDGCVKLEEHILSCTSGKFELSLRAQIETKRKEGYSPGGCLSHEQRKVVARKLVGLKLTF